MKRIDQKGSVKRTRCPEQTGKGYTTCGKRPECSWRSSTPREGGKKRKLSDCHQIPEEAGG